MWKILSITLLGLLLFGVMTLVALEGNEVVILHSGGVGGKAQSTRAWIADIDGGAALIEAANPEREFLSEVKSSGTLRITRRGDLLTCQARILPNPDGHVLIRRLLLERYGWADRWVALLADTTRSLAVELKGCAPGPR